MRVQLSATLLVSSFANSGANSVLAQEDLPSLKLAQNFLQSEAAEQGNSGVVWKCDRACDEISKVLPKQVFFGKEGNHVFWDMRVADLPTTCRVEPESTAQVVLAYDILMNMHCHFGIKSGGHAQIPGATNSDGVVIDMARLSHIELAEDRKSLKVGSGAVWMDVYHLLERYGLYVAGGRVGDVGVGGLILGGGISFWTSKEGFAVDHVHEIELVLPSSEIVTTSAHVYPDLFQSLKGAGQNNFGIVTSFTLATYELPNPAGIWRRMAVYPWDAWSTLSEAQERLFVDTQATDPGSTCEFLTIVSLAGSGKMVWLEQLHVAHDDPTSLPPAFEHHSGIPIAPLTDLTRIQPLSNITIEKWRRQPVGLRSTYATFSFRPNASLYIEIASLFEEAMADLGAVEGGRWGVMMQPISKLAIEAGMATRSQASSSSSSTNALGLQPQDGPLTILLLPWSWKLEKDDGVVRRVQEKLMHDAERLAKDAGLWVPWRYINYAAEWQQPTPYEAYGHHEWLKAVQRKYDPAGVYTADGLARGWFKLNTEVSQGHSHDEL